MNGSVDFRAGAGKCEISYPIDMFPFQDGPDLWTGIHDVPCVRAVILEGGPRMALVSLEAVLLDRELETQVRRMVSQLTGIPADQIWLSATHTVSTPHFLLRPHNPPEENAVATRMREDVLQFLGSAAGK